MYQVITGLNNASETTELLTADKEEARTKFDELLNQAKDKEPGQWKEVKKDCWTNDRTYIALSDFSDIFEDL